MTKKKARPTLLLTEHALSDLADIEAFSTAEWGRRTAKKYLEAIESSLGLVTENPGILSSVEGMPRELQFYRVRRHWLVFDVTLHSIVLLTVIHTSMDAPARLSKLVPQLAAEVELLRARMKPRRGR